MRRLLWSLALFFACAAVPGCQLGYLMHLAHGQLTVVAGCVEVTELLADPELAPSVRSRLQLIDEVKTYAADSLGFAPEDAYNVYYDTQGEPASHVLTACARDSFTPYTWWFPIVGTVPYKGFFDEQRMLDERAAFDQTAWDVYSGKAAAYSTLGWFDDPILSIWLDYETGDLVELVLHELTHREVYLASNIRFNETLATFVGQQAAENFLRVRFGPDSPELGEYLAANRDGQRFTEAIHALRDELESFYSNTSGAAAVEGRAAIFNRGREAVAGLPFELNHYRWFQDAPDNNALILALDRYHGDLPIFAALYLACGEDLRGMVARLRKVEEAQKPRAAVLALIHERIEASAQAAVLLTGLVGNPQLEPRGFVRYLASERPEAVRQAALALLRERTGLDLPAEMDAWEAALTEEGDGSD